MSEEKKLSASKTQTPKVCKKDDPRYIMNPASNRWVKKDGYTGKILQRNMSRQQTLEHLRHHAVNTTIEHRKLLASNLSNDELLKILRKVIDLKLDDALDVLPPTKPKLVRQVGEHKVKAMKKKKSKKTKRKANVPKSRPRFKLKSPPPIQTETEAETDMPTETDVYSSESETSDSDISD